MPPPDCGLWRSGNGHTRGDGENVRVPATARPARAGAVPACGPAAGGASCCTRVGGTKSRAPGEGNGPGAMQLLGRLPGGAAHCSLPGPRAGCGDGEREGPGAGCGDGVADSHWGGAPSPARAASGAAKTAGPTGLCGSDSAATGPPSCCCRRASATAAPKPRKRCSNAATPRACRSSAVRTSRARRPSRARTPEQSSAQR